MDAPREIASPSPNEVVDEGEANNSMEWWFMKNVRSAKDSYFLK